MTVIRFVTTNILQVLDWKDNGDCEWSEVEMAIEVAHMVGVLRGLLYSQCAQDAKMMDMILSIEPKFQKALGELLKVDRSIFFNKGEMEKMAKDTLHPCVDQGVFDEDATESESDDHGNQEDDDDDGDSEEECLPCVRIEEEGDGEKEGEEDEMEE